MDFCVFVRELREDQTMVKAEAPRRSIGAQRNPDSEKAILDAAEALLAEAGLSGFSIEAVARRARAGKPTIYRWWPNRTALLLAVYQRQKLGLQDHEADSLETTVTASLRNLLGFWRASAQGTVFRSVIAEAQFEPDAAQALADYAAERRQGTASVFARALGRPAPDAETLVLADMVAAYAINRLLTGRLDISADEIAIAARLMAAGLK